MKAEARVMYLPAKGRQRRPANHQEVGKRQGIASPSRPSERTIPADTLTLDCPRL